MSNNKDALPVREDDDMINMDPEDDEEEEEDEEQGMNPADHHLYQMQAMQQAGYPMQHGEMDPNTAAAYGVHPGYSGMDYSAAAYGVDYSMQQLYYQQSMQRFLSSLPPPQQQQYLAQMQQQQRNPQQLMKYAAQQQQKYSAGGATPSTFNASSSVDPSPPSPEASVLTPDEGGKKKRGRKNGGNLDGSDSKKGEKARQRAVRHNWTQAQDDALKKAINSQQYSENGQKIRWTKISQEVFGSKLTPQSVYQRYMRVINPKLNHREWTIAEDKMLTELYHEMGDQWAQIAKKMNGVRADVWIRQRAVRLGLISESAAAASAAGTGTPTPTTTGTTPSGKSSKKKKDTTNEEGDGETDGKKKKSKKKSTTSKKKKKKKGEEDSANEEVADLDEESAKRKKIEEPTIGKNDGRRKSKNPRKGNVSVIFLADTISVKQESDSIVDPSILAASSAEEQTAAALFGEKKKAKLYLTRKVSKKNRNAKYTAVDDIMNHIYETNPQEKYVSISIKSNDIFRNFQPIPNHPLKVDCLLGLYFGTNERNICLSSYRTMVENEQFGQLDVSFPTNLVSFFSKCKLRRNSKNSLFLCVALRQAALVQALDDDPTCTTIPLYWDKHNYGATVFSSHAFVGFFSGQYPVQLRTANGILLQSPLTINVKFSDITDKLSDYPLELSKVHYRELQSNLTSHSSNSHINPLNPLIMGNESTIDQKDDILQLHYMVYKVNYINTHNRGVERLWLRWDMNCPLEDDFEANNMMIMGTNTDEDTFAQLKKHLTEKHGDRFDIQFEGREGETGSYIISMNQYKHWYQNYQYMDRKRLMLLDPSTMDVNQLTPTQKQFMDVWNNHLLENFKLLMTENEAHDACQNLYSNEKSKLDAEEMKEILAHQFLRLTSLNVISIEHFMNLLGEAKIPLSSALEQQLQHIQQLQQLQQQSLSQNMQYAQMVTQLQETQGEEEEEEEEDE